MIRSIIYGLLQAYVVVLFARIILSWFPIGLDSPLVPVVRVLSALTEPVLAPLRRALPAPLMGAMAFDLSPLVVLLVIQVILIPLTLSL